ncbi:hypothetical protein GCM10009582_10500 [Arthrobacter flavus]
MTTPSTEHPLVDQEVDTSAAPGMLEPAEDRRVLLRKRIGLVGGVVVAIIMYLILPADLEQPARVTAAIASLMALWWMTEAIPLAATALLPLVLFPILNVSTIDEVAPPYANPIIFLFMGGFLLALALQRWNLHRRIAQTEPAYRRFHDRHRIPQYVGLQHRHGRDDAAYRHLGSHPGGNRQ